MSASSRLLKHLSANLSSVCLIEERLNLCKKCLKSRKNIKNDIKIHIIKVKIAFFMNLLSQMNDRVNMDAVIKKQSRIIETLVFAIF